MGLLYSVQPGVFRSFKAKVTEGEEHTFDTRFRCQLPTALDS